MSYGLVCLTCRHYVWHESLGVPMSASYCQCQRLGIAPRPSLDARNEATAEQVTRWWSRNRRRFDA